MRKLWYVTAFALILIGVVGLFTYNDNKAEKLVTFEKTWNFDSAELRQLMITSDDNVTFRAARSSDGTNSLLLKGKGRESMVERINHTVISNQSLELDLVKSNKSFMNIFNFDIGRSKPQQELILTVHDNVLLDLLKLKLDSGNLRILDADLLELTEVKLSIDSGNMTLNNFKSTSLSLDVDSGNFHGEQVSTKLTASIDSGNFELKDYKGQSKISIDSGNLRLYKLDNSDTEISADSGNVYVQVPSSFAGIYDLKADSGRIRSPESKGHNKDLIRVRTDSGNIRIEEK